MSLFDIIKTLIPLFLIVALMYGVLVFVKKYGIKINGNKTGSIHINVISSQMIMPKKYISVVKVEDKLLVLGVSEQSITLLKELNQTEDPLKPNTTIHEKMNFLDSLKKNLGLK